ncbi:aminoglycoside phosphotransferase [Gordonia sp. 852002-10350_SCH5691597]|nr:aminoglycoside phosphotransferase [Gordonia sp. 852002-10350_SCH5691597]
MSASVTDLAIPDVDTDALLTWLSDNGIGLDGQVTATRIGGGQSNLTYLLTDGSGRRFVLRRPPVGHLLASAHDVAREARILSALAPTDVPVPEVYGVCTDEAVAPVPVVVMDFVDGISLEKKENAELLPLPARRNVGTSMMETLAHIHAVDLDATGLTDLASHKPYAQRQLKRWAAQWENSKTREIPEVDSLTRRLAENVPEQHETSLVHGDFHIRNVMVDPKTGDVQAALDWELSTLGDPLADIGSTLAYWPEVGEEIPGRFSAETMEGFPTPADVAADYLRITGRDPEALKYWRTLGLWKVAIIIEGVVRRIQDDPTNRAVVGAPAAELVNRFVDKASEMADEAGLA